MATASADIKSISRRTWLSQPKTISINVWPMKTVLTRGNTPVEEKEEQSLQSL